MGCYGRLRAGVSRHSIQDEFLGIDQPGFRGTFPPLHQRTFQPLAKIPHYQENRGGLPALPEISFDLGTVRSRLERSAPFQQIASGEVSRVDRDGIVHGNQHISGKNANIQLGSCGQITLTCHLEACFGTLRNPELKPWYNFPRRVAKILGNLLTFSVSGCVALLPGKPKQQSHETRNPSDDQNALPRKPPPGRTNRLGSERREIDVLNNAPSAVRQPAVNQARRFQGRAAAKAFRHGAILGMTAVRADQRVHGSRSIFGHGVEKSRVPKLYQPTTAHHSTISECFQQPRWVAPRQEERGGAVPAMRGFTMVETLVALTLLAFALLSLAMLFPLETQLAGVSEVSNETATVVQRELSQISTHAFDSSGSFVDMSGNTVEVGCPGPPGTSCGNPLTSSGVIDFTQPPPVGFSAQISAGGGLQFSIRWNITVTASNGKKIVAAGQVLNPVGGLAPVVQYQTLRAL